METCRRAIALSPRLDFLHLHLAEGYRELGQLEEATEEYKRTLELNPRSGESLAGAGRAGPSIRRQRRRTADTSRVPGSWNAQRPAALSPGPDRRPKRQPGRGEPPLSGRHAPDTRMGLALAALGRERGSHRSGRRSTQSIQSSCPGRTPNPAPYLSLGRFHSSQGQSFQARRYLEQVLALAPDSEEAREARSLLRTVDR